MKWFDKFLYRKLRDMWDNKDKYNQYLEEEYINKASIKMATGMAVPSIDRGRAEGENRITFELTSAVGGKILNVRQYNDRKDTHEAQTYVIPNGEDVGERVAKIINLEMFKQ